ncbi:succinate dehydrogenase assembly factor 4, mitochondrial [Strongylocentrotus purpuratus]|uniref:Succinate dehydrogenase assembly factor 4, mitochondrial n=1 Tax=Strongylocentrotus purpuratus TaxID=7668 RepID=A0A7M7RDB2_STRPU|nr:succinate dehydrogenase assembly factor 4, mitochondrial [Strongylocentrotus purpuratus]|eukprot:XP_782052.1 PREDICTED: succinate dehydrogenase assembly factor 4, mitochondrial-like [Strongylocentrotus purpuratus]
MAASRASNFCLQVVKISQLKPFTQCSVTAARQMIFTTPIRCASASSNGNQGNGDQSSGRAPLKKPFTPVGKHDDHMPEKHRDAEKEALKAFPDDVNPETGEKGGPRGPEPTRYGDWERKGRCIDF